MSKRCAMHVHICNMAPHEGSCVIGGRTWRWCFGDYVGPLFVDKDGRGLKNQPSEKNPVWEKFHDWLEELKGPLPWREAERAIQRGIANGTIKVSRRKGTP